MVRRIVSLRIALLAGNMLAASPVLAADVTPERLLNPDKEPQNWLMSHRTYDGQRFWSSSRLCRAWRAVRPVSGSQEMTLLV